MDMMREPPFSIFVGIRPRNIASDVVLNLSEDVCLVRIDVGFQKIPEKKSKCVKLHDFGGQFILPFRGITRWGNFSCKRAIV